MPSWVTAWSFKKTGKKQRLKHEVFTVCMMPKLDTTRGVEQGRRNVPSTINGQATAQGCHAKKIETRHAANVLNSFMST